MNNTIKHGVFFLPSAPPTMPDQRFSFPPLPRRAVGSGCEQNNVNVWRHLTSLLAFRAQPNHSGPKPIGN